MTGTAAIIGISLTLTISVPISTAANANQFHSGEEVVRWSDSLATTSPIAALPAITGSDEIDALIRTRAEVRGYRPRELATGPLESVDGHLLQAEAAAAWRELDDAARAAGHRMRLVAGFRDLATQRSLFLRRLNGHSETAIDATLKWSAPPGYSKHHTGYAIDITQSGSTAGGFGSSASYAWLAADNYLNAKRFGFIPSYPPNATLAGPEPEPWEWVYVGVDELVCPSSNRCRTPAASPAFRPI